MNLRVSVMIRFADHTAICGKTIGAHTMYPWQSGMCANKSGDLPYFQKSFPTGFGKLRSVQEFIGTLGAAVAQKHRTHRRLYQQFAGPSQQPAAMIIRYITQGYIKSLTASVLVFRRLVTAPAHALAQGRLLFVITGHQ